MAIGIGLVVFAVIRSLLSYHQAGDKEERFRAMLSDSKTAALLGNWCASAPARLLRRWTGLDPAKHYAAKADREKLELHATGYLVDVDFYVPELSRRQTELTRQVEELRRARGLYNDGVDFGFDKVEVVCRRPDLPRWRKEFGPLIKQPVDLPSLVRFGQGGAGVPCSLPDGSQVSLAEACRWVNSRVAVGGVVGITREPLRSGAHEVRILAE